MAGGAPEAGRVVRLDSFLKTFFKNDLTKADLYIILIIVIIIDLRVSCKKLEENTAKNGTRYWISYCRRDLIPALSGYTTSLNPGYPAFLWLRYTGISAFL
jgi:hypothetical protein